MNITFDRATFQHNHTQLIRLFDWKIQSSENWAITGTSGSGKTNIIKALHGNYILTEGTVQICDSHENTLTLKDLRQIASFVFFEDQEINYNQFYYQQRYNSSEWEGTLTVRTFLENEGFTETLYRDHKLNTLFEIDPFLDREFIKLSNGEIRKILILKALLKNPQLLILDDPYIGLDRESKQMINSFLASVMSAGIQVILVTKEQTLPEGISKILYLRNDRQHRVYPLSKWNGLTQTGKKYHLNHSFDAPVFNNFTRAFEMNKVTICYGETKILDSVNWTVYRGEKWALSGRNGAGKSMLMSLLNADNPQAYANNLILFDKKRGQGESIWDIKSRTGFLSPEVHFYFNKHILNKDAIWGGLFENPYVRTDIGDYHDEWFHYLTEYFRIRHLLDRWFFEISTGQQRLILFLRVLLRNTPLLLLDEPFQGFDPEMIGKAKVLLDTFCANRTLIFVSHNEFEFPDTIHRFAHLEKGILSLT